MPRNNEIDENIGRQALEVLAADLLDTLPGSEILAASVDRELPQRFLCDVAWSEPLLRTDLARLSKRLDQRLEDARAALVEAESRVDEARPATRLTGYVDRDLRGLRRLLARHDQTLERGHAKLASALGLFGRELGSAGQIVWTPRGTTVLRALEDALRGFLVSRGCAEVRGFADSPSAVFESAPRGASEMPLGFFEIVESHADAEPSPVRVDLRRARRRRQDRCRVFLRDDQLSDELATWAERVELFYRALGISVKRVDDDRAALAYDAHGLWGDPLHRASRVRRVTVGRELRCQTNRGETIPVLHLEASLADSVESLLASILEENPDGLPLWLAPEQVAVVPIAHRSREHAERVHARLQSAGLRSAVDRRQDSWENKVRQPVNDRTPYFVVLGNREAEEGGVDARTREEPRRSELLPLEAFAERVAREARPPF